MNRVFVSLFVLFFLNNCSFNENSSIWNKKNTKPANKKNIKEVLITKKIIAEEFNAELKLDLNKVKSNNKITDLQNNYGSSSYQGLFEEKENYNFSKIDDFKQLNLKPAFINKDLIFFDKKGTVIRFDENQKIVWKKNYYSKAEKKLSPKLLFAINKDQLIIADNIAKYFSINLKTGKLNWSKNSSYPFNSEIKIYKDKFFIVDYKNTLKCFNVSDGSQCWEVPTEDSFTISNSKFSQIISKDLIIFNNSIGDITAVNYKTGLLAWQLPTQNNNIINETYSFKMSKLVSDRNSIFFSNNNNEFYSIDLKTGTINWTNDISSNLSPVIIDNFIFTVSNYGYLFVLQKNNGNIIRVNDLYKNYKKKNRNNITPVGFTIGNTNLYLSNNDGKMIVVDLITGQILKIKKIARNTISEPFIYNERLYVIKNGTIISYD